MSTATQIPTISFPFEEELTGDSEELWGGGGVNGHWQKIHNDINSVCVWSLGTDWLIGVTTYPHFGSMKQPEVFLLPLDRMLVHYRSLRYNLLGFSNNSPVPIYIPGWGEVLSELIFLPKNTTVSLARARAQTTPSRDDSALNMRPPCLHIYINVVFSTGRGTK